MDRLQGIAGLRRWLAHALVALGALTACSGPAPSLRVLAPGEGAEAPAASFRHRIDAARGVLGYSAAIRGNVVVSVELAERFEIVSRDLTAGAMRELARVDLGPSDYDIDGLAVDATGSTAYVASVDGTVRAIDLVSGNVRTQWHLGAAATAIALSDDGAYVATGTETGVVCLRRAADGALLHCVVAHTDRVAALDFATGALASCSWDGTATVWDVPSMAARARRTDLGSANDIELAPDSSRIAIARSARPPVRTPEIADHERANGFASAELGAVVDIWDLMSGSVATLTGHAAAVTSVAWTPDGDRVVSASWDRSVRLWNPSTAEQLYRAGDFDYLVRDIAIDARGARFVTAAWIEQLDARSISIFDLLYTRGGRDD